MPKTSLHARRNRYAPRKKTSIVRRAMRLSVVKKFLHVLYDGSEPMPNVERPRARRMMLSNCSSAAVVAGEVWAAADSTDNAVAEEGIGVGRCVARNMW